MAKDEKETLQWHPAFYAGIQIEYKSPTDSLSIDDFYKVYGYACFYKSDTTAVDKIPSEEIAITFVCKRFPRNLVQKLLGTRRLTLQKVDDGIHYLIGDHFPIQIVVTSQLSAENNFWLRNLTNDLQDRSLPDTLFRKYQPKQHNISFVQIMSYLGGKNQCVKL